VLAGDEGLAIAIHEGWPGQWHFLSHHRGDGRLVSCVLLPPGFQKVVSRARFFPPGVAFFLPSARSLSESGGLAALS
jgi:hypothetical protein